MGDSVLQWLSLLSHSKKIVGLILGLGPCVRSLCVLPVPVLVWVLIGFSSFLSQFKNAFEINWKL